MEIKNNLDNLLTKITPQVFLEYGFSLRVIKCLARANLLYIGDISRCTKQELLRIPNLSRNCVKEIEGILKSHGLYLRNPND